MYIKDPKLIKEIFKRLKHIEAQGKKSKEESKAPKPNLLLKDSIVKYDENNQLYISGSPQKRMMLFIDDYTLKCKSQSLGYLSEAEAKALHNSFSTEKELEVFDKYKLIDDTIERLMSHIRELRLLLQANLNFMTGFCLGIFVGISEQHRQSKMSKTYNYTVAKSSFLPARAGFVKGTKDTNTENEEKPIIFLGFEDIIKKTCNHRKKIEQEKVSEVKAVIKATKEFIKKQKLQRIQQYPASLKEEEAKIKFAVNQFKYTCITFALVVEIGVEHKAYNNIEPDKEKYDFFKTILSEI